jgi:hypothetical protein
MVGNVIRIMQFQSSRTKAYLLLAFQTFAEVNPLLISRRKAFDLFGSL